MPHVGVKLCLYFGVWHTAVTFHDSLASAPPQQCILGPTQDGCALAEVLKKSLFGEILRIVIDFQEHNHTKSATRVAGL